MVDLNALVQESAAVFEPLMEEKSVQLLVQLPPQRAAVNVDRSRIRQVLHNLLANALRHTPSGGQVTIAVAQPAGRLRLTVQDTGEGIAPENLEHIFDRFYRTDPSRSRETGGSGLGLAIVKAIVEAHGGEVTASSGGVGRGTRFTIFLAVG
jgi:signal transduction histidine kinase